MDLGLTGSTVVVTGGTGAIGHGIVLEFAREGANVVSASRDAAFGAQIAEEARAARLPGTVVAITTDVTDRASVDGMIAQAHEHFGPVRALVNNAGGLAHRGAFEEINADARAWEIALNINGVVNCSLAASEDMIKAGRGSIVNISSLSSLQGQAAHHNAHYGAAKGFVDSLTRGLAYEWAPRGIRVNNIAPGWTVPRTLDEVGAGSAWKRIALRTPDEMQQDLEAGNLRNMSGIPLGRLGRPEDIAALACFLSSDAASYVTGQRIAVSGGVYQN